MKKMLACCCEDLFLWLWREADKIFYLPVLEFVPPAVL